MSRGPASGLTLVGASAGSGKTHRLTEEVMAAIQPSTGTKIPLEGLVAVTYTRKAQAELAARIRRKLVGAGAFDESVQLPLAILGTVHAACLRLLQEFALEAGLSPHVEPVGGDPRRLLQEALEAALDPALSRQMQELAGRIQPFYDYRTRRHDWLRPVSDVMELARNNRIAPDQLPAMGRRSAAGVLAFLPPRRRSGAPIDAALVAAIATALPVVEKLGLVIPGAAKAAARLREVTQTLGHGPLPWADWLALAKITGTAGAEGVLAPLRQAAAAYERHPRFHDDLRDFTTGVFESARVGLRAYADWKASRRLVDYTDMIDRALTLVEDPAIASVLADRLRMIVVDEFQDTSPLQLALFVRLHGLARRSIWVGDRKQCIFEYAGADPQLMEAVTAWVTNAGGATEQLPTNYRSRPELVQFTSELFVQALARHGFAAAEVRVASSRVTPKALAKLPPLGIWWLAADNLAEEAAAITAGVARLLAKPAATPVVDRQTNQIRDLRPGDVAVLVATNREALAIATELHVHGVHAAVARPGLLQTPEGTLVDAALRLLLDPRDTLSAAVLDALADWNGVHPDQWLTGKLAAARAETRGDAGGSSTWGRALEALRSGLGVLSPTEAIDRVILALDAETACSRWPDPAQRLANLDAIRALAVEYEDRCRRRREAGTPAGLLRYFDEAQDIVLVRDEELATDDQHVREGDDVVTISTYHRAKGLEWPVVVLASLDKRERRGPFDVSPDSDRASFDAEDPLGGRWIRYWPWPFASAINAPLRDHASASPAGLQVAAREDRERVRLLYVGFTRARDHLVLALRLGKKKPAIGWLEALQDDDGTCLLDLPVEVQEAPAAKVRPGTGAALTTRVWTVAPTEPDARKPDKARWFARRAAPSASAPYWILPSGAAADDGATWLPRAAVGDVVSLAGRLDFTAIAGVAWDVAGTALHGFFACDVEGLSTEERHARARRLLGAGGLTGIVRPEDAVAAADALRAFVDSRYAGARWRREVPVTALVGDAGARQRVEGVIDLLLETADGDVIIDHKSFPGQGASACRAKATVLAPQLMAYREALGRLGRTVRGCWFHFPVGGVVVEVEAAP